MFAGIFLQGGICISVLQCLVLWFLCSLQLWLFAKSGVELLLYSCEGSPYHFINLDGNGFALDSFDLSLCFELQVVGSH